jgi:F0F1-type ATP synthase assembly protein I
MPLVSSHVDHGKISTPKGIALRFVLLQFGTTGILSALLLAHSTQSALSAGIGGLAVVCANLTMIGFAFRHQGADNRYLILGSFGVGQVTKTGVYVMLMLIAHQVLSLDWLSVLLGVAQAQLSYLWAGPLLMRD